MKDYVMKYALIVIALMLSWQLNAVSSAPEKTFTMNVLNEDISFVGDFYVLYRSVSPEMEIRDIIEGRYFAPTWKGIHPVPEDGFLFEEGRTFNYFSAGDIYRFVAEEQHWEGDALCLSYPENEVGALKVRAHKVDGSHWKLTFTFIPAKEGYYSIVYMGAPAEKKEQIDFIFQPLVWQQKRFPLQSYMSLAYMCSLPAAFLNSAGKSWGVVAAPEEFPFDPLPDKTNNRFGILSKDDQGTFRPMLAAPVLGGLDSFMKIGERYSFNFYLYASEEEPSDVYESISRKIYQFKDYRHNEICNLNETIDNMVDYSLSEYSCFIDSLKGCSYSSDVPGSVNNSNSLNPISIALLSDDSEMFYRRAIPITEYMMSRKKPLFCLDTTQKTQSPTRSMGGPCASLNELAGLHYFSQNNDSYFMDLIQKGKYRNSKSWENNIDLYRATGNKKYLDQAIKDADEYIQVVLPRESTSLTNKGFWNAYSPKFKNLLELYEVSGEKRFLEAAHEAARMYAMYIWMCPMIPDQKVLVNKGGVAPHYWYLKGKGFPQMKAIERYVDAWRLSEIGLLPESSRTSIGHRAVFMAHHAPYMYRIAHLTNDSFLKDIARSAIVGRYRNFPGYHINTMRTDIYEQADYPLHQWSELSVNTFHYNHILPMISMLYDYLITDFWHKSGEQISFVGFHTEAHAYLQAKVYGNQTGTFYGHENVSLWIPKHVLEGVDTELNYLIGKDDKNLYLSFSNQNNEKVSCLVGFDETRIKLDDSKVYDVEVYDAAGNKENKKLTGGKLAVEVEASGIRSFVIKNVRTEVVVQDRFFDRTSSWSRSGAVKGKYAGSHAYVIDFGKDLKEAYAYIESDDNLVQKVRFDFSMNGESTSFTDKDYPFEFTVPVPEECNRIVVNMEITYRDGKVKNDKLQLRK